METLIKEEEALSDSVEVYGQNLRYDGPFPPIGYQFTELDRSYASYGTSFIVTSTDPVAVSRRREEKRIEFESAERV